MKFDIFKIRKNKISNAPDNNNKKDSAFKEFVIEFGEINQFIGLFFRNLFIRPFEWKEFIRQAYYIGINTFAIIGITAFIMGLVLTLQSRPVLVDFGAESWLPGMISVSIVREIGPVITALICAGKIGSGIGAELGSMKVTEQIDAMEISGANPIKYLVVTRVLATTLMIPVLVLYADAISFYGCYVAVNMHAYITLKLFIIQAFETLHFFDIIPATIKTFFFGFAIGIIGCFKGYNTGLGTEGVGKAANSAVVWASLAIFIIDLVAVPLHEMIDIFHL